MRTLCTCLWVWSSIFPTYFTPSVEMCLHEPYHTFLAKEVRLSYDEAEADVNIKVIPETTKSVCE